MRTLAVRRESWPLRRVFAISRGAHTKAEVVVAEIQDGAHRGWGECVPYRRYDESPDSVVAQIRGTEGLIRDGADHLALERALPPGAARNALDCALWDLEGKRRGCPVWQLAGVPAPEPVTTAFTISLDTPEAMAQAAADAARHPLLKLKLGGDGDVARVAAVRRAAPSARLIVDANEAWTPAQLPEFLAAMAGHGVELVEQPLPADQDALLGELTHPVPLCADESCHTRDDLPRLLGRYEVVNVKLDKTGGLTEALRLLDAARALGFGIMVGTMVGTSLLMAPALLLTHAARWVDLDGPLWMAQDRPRGLKYLAGQVQPPERELWG